MLCGLLDLFPEMVFSIVPGVYPCRMGFAEKTHAAEAKKGHR
jgi:hypothetical protein